MPHAAATRAVELDPTSQIARFSLANVHFFEDDLEGFSAEAEKALALNPNNTEIMASLAVRFCALAVDLTLVWLLAIPLGLLATALGWDKSVNSEWPGLDPAVVLGGLALWLLYFGLSEGLFG